MFRGFVEARMCQPLRPFAQFVRLTSALRPRDSVRRSATGVLWLFSGLLFATGCASVPLRELPVALDCPAPNLASIHGVVETRSGQPVANAKVTFPGYDSTTILETDSGGYFLFACVVPGGGYEMRIDAPGFHSQRFDGIEATVPATELYVTLLEAK